MAARKEPDPRLEGLGPMAKKATAATFASNWKTVLAVDASMGIVLAVVGFVLRRWIGWFGWIAVALGVIYVFLVFRRFLQWRWLREHAGV